MLKQFRLSLPIVVLVILLTGCAGGAYGGIPLTTELVDDTNVVRIMAYYDQADQGNDYVVSFSVPDEWVGMVETVSNGKSISVQWVDEVENNELFVIYALSLSQYWEQNGSYPQQFTSLKSQWDTYFVFHRPQNLYYTRLEDAELDAILDQISVVVTSFDATTSQQYAFVSGYDENTLYDELLNDPSPPPVGGDVDDMGDMDEMESDDESAMGDMESDEESEDATEESTDETEADTTDETEADTTDETEADTTDESETDTTNESETEATEEPGS